MTRCPFCSRRGDPPNAARYTHPCIRDSVKSSETAVATPVRRLALLNGRIYTQNPAQPTAQAVASIGNRIVAVGSDEDALAAAGPGAETVDLGGRAVVPGFVDAHFHFLGYSFDRQRVRLDRATSIAEVQALV